MDFYARVREALKERSIPAMLVSEMGNIEWLTGFTGSFAYVALTETDGVFITDSRYTEQAGEQVKGLPVVSFASPTDRVEFLRENLEKLGVTRLGFEATYVTYAIYEKMKDKLTGVELVSVDDLFTELRMVKTAGEVAKIRTACEMTDACFDHVRKFIQTGVSEHEISLEIEFFFRRQGADVAFTPIVVSGVRSSRPHGRASEKKLEKGDFLTLDFGAKVDGYNADMTRTVVVGEATDRHREMYAAVLEAQLAGIAAIKPGVAARDVDGAARGVLRNHGLAEYFGHGLGHGLGKAVHDGGALNPSSTNTIAEGQVWTVEPGAYIPGFGGVRIEDDVVVTKSGCEMLNRSPKELLVLPS
jgi:Xaa-Pro aminopeptidase